MFGVGLATLWLSLLVFIPLGAVVWRSQKNGFGSFWHAATTPRGGRRNSADGRRARCSLRCSTLFSER